jgi:hypothetical protein
VKYKRNALRHSFGSYRMETVKNAGQVALEMGNSAPRYTLVMFPIYILLARIARHRIAAWIITTWCLLSAGLFIALFVRGWWVS